MSLGLAPVFRQRFFDHSSGAPLSGGKLYSYIAGTTTPTATYQDAFGNNANPNPIILDANGECEVFITLGSNAYKFILTDSNDVEQWSVDNISIEGITGPSGWSEFALTDGQAATVLAAMTMDITKNSSIVFDAEIIRGTGTFANLPGGIAIQNVNGTGRVCMGGSLAKEQHGVTFTVTQSGNVIQLLAACNSGPGDGSLKLRQTLIAA